MATATVATAAGAAALLYYTLKWKLYAGRLQDSDEGEHSEDERRPILAGRNRVSQRPAQAPATWLETISTLSETLRFTYSETLGKWPIGDLAFGINFLLKRQGNLHVASIYAGEESIPLKGVEVVAELKYLLNLLTLCWHFSKKPFPLFLEATGYSEEDVLLQKPKAGILKPAFTILIDRSTKCILLLIRGTHSIRDTLTAVTGAIVPFHHTIINEGGISDLVLGYAHCGMVAAARWIAKLATPCLLDAFGKYPDFKLKIVGHSLGGGTAALLTYTLREQKEFATAACVTFAPAACMTWELAESGRHFATSIINGADLVPSFSAASVDDLRVEVTASAWINDLRSQIEQTRILSTVYRSASALGSRLPSIASARARVAGAGAILRPVSNGTQVVVTRAKSVAQAALRRPPLHLSSWSCIGPRYRKQASFPNSRIEENIEQQTTTITENGHARLKETITVETTEIITSEEAAGWSSDPECSRASKLPHTDGMEVNGDDSDEDISDQRKPEESMTEYELWQQLENELYKPRSDEEAEMENEIREEENAAASSAAQEGTEVTPQGALTETKESQRFYPPGKIMHIVTLHPEEEMGDEEDAHTNHDCKIEIYSTPRSLYGKLRLSQSMINDHYMPIYRRNIEQLISILEKDCHGDGSIS
ncbi:uncharacterized protein LOC121986267 isoform X1 [Zingiber officinale]|uniref:uncharacterized protein LOC121986267 isoform X1 n=1 Tax=Zingiber officinale TaxID=94328 RepID=UPI001C4D83A3|nr:uncharacterized protein LOC121986267 isoform X1 [Zingiber officinale]XP_042396072.1 uncharacterized protein LOC121986267 isoform X1 [Zingiber officinale]XP_042396073.1 uncharacterized protein LOC121986267 isoform X1 [Zingiber officinale]